MQWIKTFFLVTITIFSIFLTSLVQASENKGKVIVYNWSEYIPQDVLDDFTKETGIEVVYSTFESNEAMFIKIKLQKGKGYDVVIPSGYFIKSMEQNNLLTSIDKSKLTNISNIDPQWLHQEYDKDNKVSIPYMWGAVGIAYNKKYIPEGSIVKWIDLLDPKFKGKLIFTDDQRDAFGIALKATGSSANSANENSIKKAYDFLLKLKESIRIFDVTATKQALISEEAWAGPIWNGDFLVAKEENPDLEFIFPEEGAILWMDNFVIPSGSEDIENAHTFINFMLRPEIAKRCVEEYKYSTPNEKALNILTEEMKNNPILVPTPSELKNAEFPSGVGSAITLYQKYWEKLKTTR